MKCEAIQECAWAVSVSKAIWLSLAMIFMVALVLLLNRSVSADYRTTFTPTISVDGEYTGNVFYAREDTEADFITIVSPGFDLEIDGKNKGLTLSYIPGASFYSNNSENDAFRHNASLRSWIDFSRTLRVEIYDNLQRTEEPLNRPEDIVAVDPETTTIIDSTRRVGREPFTTNTAGIRLTQQIGKTDSLSVEYVYRLLENEAADLEDNASHNPSLTYSHQFDPFLSLDVDAAYEQGMFSGDSDDFDNWQGGFTLTRQFTKKLSGNVRYAHTYMDFDGVSLDYHVFDPSVGFSYVLDEDTSLSLNVGYFLQDRQDGDDESGLSLDGNIGKSWQFRRGAIIINGATGYGESYLGAENLGFTTYYQASARGNYSFTKSFSGRILGSFRKNDYVNTTDDRNDKIATASIGFTYDPLTISWFNVSLTYTYNKMDSSVDENDYEEDRVQLNVTLEPYHTLRW